jgi:hypothetical protein
MVRGLSLWFERHFQTDRFRVKVYVDTRGWSIDVTSDTADMSFKASCHSPRACLWVHQIFLAYANVVAMMVGRPDLVTEALQFTQDLYRNMPEERMVELILPELGAEGEAVFYTKDYFEKFKGKEVRVELKTGAVIKGVIKEVGESTLTVDCTDDPCTGEELIPLSMVRKIWE